MFKRAFEESRMSREAKNALYDALTTAARALGTGRRAELIDVLAQGERSVEQLAAEIEQSVANTSHPLRSLATAGLVSTRRDGTRIYYRLASSAVEDLWAALRRVAAEQVDAFDAIAAAYLPHRGNLPTISRGEVAASLGRIVVLDVRPAREYSAGHIPGAVHVEPGATETSTVFTGRVVAYCRGEFCRYADDTVVALRARGVDAVRLEDGFPEWRRAGLPVETGAAR